MSTGPNEQAESGSGPPQKPAARAPVAKCPYSKPELLREVWGFKALGNTRTVDAHACRLRKKLARAGAPHLIANVRGVGYRLSAGPVVVEPEAVVVPLSGNGRAA